MAKLLPANLVCPRCGNGNYMRWLNDVSKEYDLKCTNCNTYWKLSTVTHLPDTDVGEFAKDTDVPSKSVTNQNRLTNADRIRAMSDEELAEWIAKYMDCAECKNMNGYKPCHNGECCPDHWLDWLKRPAEG